MQNMRARYSKDKILQNPFKNEVIRTDRNKLIYVQAQKLKIAFLQKTIMREIQKFKKF